VITAYITIGNSDDKLSQADWSAFCADVYSTIDRTVRFGGDLQFAGYSAPAAPWQNAQWCVQVPDDATRSTLRTQLRELCRRYRQESIAWAQVEQVEMLGPVTLSAVAG
jgi:hypothetical protein